MLCILVHLSSEKICSSCLFYESLTQLPGGRTSAKVVLDRDARVASVTHVAQELVTR
jgi:hypothetical protein